MIITAQKVAYLWYMQQENALAQKQNIQSNVILGIKQAYYGSKNITHMVGGKVYGKSGFCLNEEWIAEESLVFHQYKRI